MPKGQKRNYKGDHLTPMVGVKICQNKETKLFAQEGIAMIQNLGQRISKRASKAKQKIDFIYENDKESVNNNAQVTPNPKNKKAEFKLEKKTEKNLGNCKAKSKEECSGQKCINHIFDGVQVTVNSDEEELDYEDDILDNNEDEMDYSEDKHDEHQTVVSPQDKCTPLHNTSHDKEIGQRSTENESVNMALGATSTTLMDEELVLNNPHLRKLLNKMLDKRIQDARNKGESS